MKYFGDDVLLNHPTQDGVSVFYKEVIDMGRNPKTGRFLAGNEVAVGNKGNTKPKWGNKNAVKHGFFETFVVQKLQEDGSLHLYKRGIGTIVIRPGGFMIDDGVGIRFRNDVAERLEDMGFELET